MGLEEEKITEKDVIDVMEVFTQVPVVILKMVISQNVNVVKTFESQIEDYRSKLSAEDMVKIEKVLKMQVPELQEILGKAYKKTGTKQLGILADPDSEPFITENFRELRIKLFE